MQHFDSASRWKNYQIGGYTPNRHTICWLMILGLVEQLYIWIDLFNGSSEGLFQINGRNINDIDNSAQVQV